MKNLTTQQLNQLTVVFAVLTVLSCLCSVVTFFNPRVFFNVLEPTRVAPHVLPTTTPSPIRYPTLPPEWTSTPSPTITPVRPAGTATAVPSVTRTSTATGPTATSTRTHTATRTRPGPRPRRRSGRNLMVKVLVLIPLVLGALLCAFGWFLNSGGHPGGARLPHF